MPYIFSLPTTSVVNFSAILGSDTHPSLILSATTHRSVLRAALKRHKQLPLPSQASNLSLVVPAVENYLPFLFALDAGISGKLVDGEEVDVVLEREVEVEWRPSLGSASPGRQAARVRGRGLDYEICFVLTTLGYIYSSLARAQLHTLYASAPPSQEQRTVAITTATKHLLRASSLHEYVGKRSSDMQFPLTAIDVHTSTQNALASLALAEATLLAVLKDDPYPAVVAQARDSNDREWMIKDPDIPKVRAHLFARLALAAADHTVTANALLRHTSKGGNLAIHSSLLKYGQSLHETARAKACRFFGIDAELGGQIGNAISWLKAGKKELSFKANEDESVSIKGFAKLKKDWSERRQDKKTAKGGEWGLDAGRLEEARVIEMLEKKCHRTNDLVSLCEEVSSLLLIGSKISHQMPPSPESLVAAMPSGRDIHIPKPYVPPNLDTETLARLRAPPEDAAATADGDDSSDEDEEPLATIQGTVPGPSSGSAEAYF